MTDGRAAASVGDGPPASPRALERSRPRNSGSVAGRRISSRRLIRRARREGPEDRYTVVSVDVFDTALTRSCGPPAAVFLYLGRLLRDEGVVLCTPEVFARARAQADRDVWHRAGGLDAPVTLEDFHREVCRVLWLDPTLVPELVAAELRLEARVLRPVPATRELIARRAAAGARIVFTTDTYFPRDFLEEELRRHGTWSPRARVFASTDTSTSKAGGGLFGEVLAALEVEGSEVLHVGDNLHSDVEMARRRGLATSWFDHARLNRYELLLADRMWATAGLSAAMAGASRLARLDTPVSDHRDRAIRDVACGVAAPFLVGYVLWVLRRAELLGLTRLYFVARDGQVMAEIAERLVARLGLDLEIRYLYASRDATNLAATLHADEEELGWVARDLGELSSRDVLARLDLSSDDVADTLERYEVALDAPAGSGDPRRTLDALTEPGPARDRLLERARDRRELVTGYLRQEGLLDGTASGIVDFGGVGSQMRAIHTLVSVAGGVPPRLFLVGLDDPAQAGLATPLGTPDWLAATDCYLYDHRRRLGARRRRGFGTCVQMFCAADHGTVTGYARERDRVVPRLREEVDDELVAWGLPLLRRSVLSFTEHLDLDDTVVDVFADVREPTSATIDLFWSQPTREESEAWGGFPFEGAQVVNHARDRLARRYSWPYVLEGLARGTFPDLGWMHWYEGSLRSSPVRVRLPLRVAQAMYRRLEAARGPRARSLLRLVRRILGRRG